MKIPVSFCLTLLIAMFILGLGCRDTSGQGDPNSALRSSVEEKIDALVPDSLSGRYADERLAEILTDLESLARDTLPRSLYDQLFEKVDSTGNTRLRGDLLHQAQQAAMRVSDSLSLGTFQLEMSQFYWRQGAPDSTYLFASRAFKVFDNLGDSFLAGRSALNMAAAQYTASDFAEAEQTAISALDLFEHSGDPDANRRIIITYNLLGSIAASLNAFDRALSYRETALEYLGTGEQEGRTYYGIMNNIGSTLIEAGNYREALEPLSAVLNNPSVRADIPGLYARALVNKARANFELGHMESVEADYLEALELRQSSGDIRSLPRSHYFLAQYYWQLKDTARTRDFLSRGKEIALETEELDGLQDILKLQLLADPQNSARYGLELAELKDSLIQQERNLRDKFARVRYQTDQYIAENRILERQRLVWIWIAIGALLAGIALFVIITQRIRNQKLLFQQKQQETNQEIFNLMLSQNEKIEAGKQEEQKRISEELHDGVLGEMNGIRMVLLGLNGRHDPDSQEIRSGAIEKLKAVQEEIRGISHALSDSAYQKFHNFILSLEDLVSGICEGAGLEFQLNYDGDTDWDGLAGEVKINLYRIIQECLQNTIRHAEASEVKVELESSPGLLKTRISDNGKGFRKRRGKKGIGQKNIASRVAKLGGSWELHSAPGQGTEVRIAIPLGVGQQHPNDPTVADPQKGPTDEITGKQLS